MYNIGPSSTLSGVPQAEAFRGYISVDEGGDRGPEGFQLIGADPEQEPAVILDASRKSGTETSAGADADSSLVEGGRI